MCLPAFQLLLEAGRPAFQLCMFAKCDTLPNEIRGTCLFQKSIPAILSWNSKHPTYQKLGLPESGTLHQPCIMVASCPCLRCSCRKNLSYAEKQRVWSRSCGFSRIVARNLIVFSCDYGKLSFWSPWVGRVFASLSAADVCKM